MSVSDAPPISDGGERANAEHVDPEAALDALVAAGAVDEAEDGTLSTTSEFEDARRIYHDTYADADDATLTETVADVFGLDPDEAAAHVEDGHVTREEVVAYLSVRSFLDDTPDPTTLAVMVHLLVEIGPGSPVPPSLRELSDDDYRAFLDDEPDAFVTVWKQFCDPCEATKAVLDDILDALPAGVAAAGVDGEAVPEFRREFGVDAAPAFCLFRGGELAEAYAGRGRPERLGERFEAVYGDGD